MPPSAGIAGAASTASAIVPMELAISSKQTLRNRPVGANVIIIVVSLRHRGRLNGKKRTIATDRAAEFAVISLRVRILLPYVGHK
jgi:hypothetical protein